MLLEQQWRKKTEWDRFFALVVGRRISTMATATATASANPETFCCGGRCGTSLGSGSKAQAWISGSHKIRHRLDWPQAQTDDKFFSRLKGRFEPRNTGISCLNQFKPIKSKIYLGSSQARCNFSISSGSARAWKNQAQSISMPQTQSSQLSPSRHVYWPYLTPPSLFQHFIL